jgi:hypothetical protein
MSAEPAAAAVTHCAEGLEYFDVGGLQAFRCASYRLTLTPQACSRSWRDAQSAKYGPAGERAACRSCPVGAAHAGQPAVSPSRIGDFPALCLRCGHGCSRLIGGRICPSCANRAYENLKGANSRGNAPVMATHVEPMAIRYAIDGGKARAWSVRQAADSMELCLDLLRRHPSARLVFLPAEGSPLPKAAPGHSVICCCSLPQRSPVRFHCVALDQPIAGHAVGVEAVNDPGWKAPMTARPHKQLAAATPKAEPRATKVDVASLILELRSKGLLAGEIATALNARGLLRGDGQPFTDRTVRRRLRAPEVPALRSVAKAKPRPVSVLTELDEQNAAAESMIAVMVSALRDCLPETPWLA